MSEWVKRAVTSWREVVHEPTWYAVLACGHEVPGPYEEDGMSAAAKAEADSDGEIGCVECTRLENEIARKQRELDEMKANLKRLKGARQ
jgi:hypothetical protein